MARATLFNQDQREVLRSLGVLDTQIAQLETVLPLCRAHLAAAPTKSDVLDVLERLERAATEFRKALNAVSTDQGLSAMRREARARLLLATFDRLEAEGSDTRFDAEIPDAIASAASIQASVAAAIADLNAEAQRRRRDADPTPVRLINQALLRGWGDHYSRGNEATPLYPFVPSVYAKSKFRQVVAVSYEAFLSKPDADPERAIKNYMLVRRRARGR